MTKSTVKAFNTTKGYGFITPDEGGPDIFMHANALEKAELLELKLGARVSFDTAISRDGKMRAENLRLL